MSNDSVEMKTTAPLPCIYEKAQLDLARKTATKQQKPQEVIQRKLRQSPYIQ